MSTTLRSRMLASCTAVVMVMAAAACGATPVAAKGGTTTPTTATTTIPATSGSTASTPGTTSPPATAAPTTAAPTTAPPTTAASTTTAPARTAAKACTISAVSAIAAESTSEDQERTASWTLLNANGWTVAAPDQDWHLSASDAGADVISPDGSADASLTTWYAQIPWTVATLAQKILGQVSNFDAVCSTPQASSATGSTVATEFTGDYQGEQIHSVIIVSRLTPTQPDLYVGEIRWLYTSASQWSASAAQTLMLIIKRAIQDPQSLTP